MAMVDVYPPRPAVPTSLRIHVPVEKIIVNLTLAVGGSTALIWILSYYLPKTSIYHRLVSESASGEGTLALQRVEHATHLGQKGTALSVLRPGGKAQFGDAILDVISQGEMIPKGSPVRIIGHSGTEAIVEPC
jgi:membrane-bound serine protease (ClpP class)